MLTPYRETYSANKNEPALVRNPLLIAIPIGIALGFCLQLLLTGFSFWASLALWPLSLAISLIFISVLSQRLHNKAQWGLVIVGQLLGALGLLLLLLSSL